MASRSESLYQPLDPSKSEIRLLKLHPRQANRPEESLHLTMFTTSLQNCERKYFALSYVWGEDISHNPVTINGHSVPVTENLLDFLFHYRDLTEANKAQEFADMPFWVDAICINQEDIDEKNSQVRQMSSIYRSADVVLSWLGVEADDSDHAVEVIIDIAGKIAAALDRDDPLSWMAPSQTELWEEDPNEGFVNRFWKGTINLMMRPYWIRAWIVQEIVLAREVKALCGLKLFQFLDLVTLSRWIMRLPSHQHPSFVAFATWIWMISPSLQEFVGQFAKYAEIRQLVEGVSITGASGTEYNWKNLLITTRRAQASDPRDKLYSMAGILQHGVTPDYSISAEETYCKFTRMYLGVKGGLQILLYAGHGLLRPSRDKLRHHLFLPSWVPNWDSLSKAGTWAPICAKMERFDTDGFMLEQDIPPYSCHGNTLEAPGIHLSEVSTHFYFDRDEERFNSFLLDYIEAHKDERGASGARVLLTVIRLLLLDRLPGSDIQLGLSPEASVLERAIVIVKLILPDDEERIEFLQEGRLIQYLDQPVDPIRLNGLLDKEAVGVRGLSALVCSIELLCGYYAIFETGQGHLGWGPPGISKGDVIGMLFGCEMPVVLRKIDSHYIYIGACYVVGIMDGDPLVGIEKGSQCIKRFNIV